jgi:diguanylate cyclase (GGDEF)-like protein/PAS domain S-box-containing protein
MVFDAQGLVIEVNAEAMVLTGYPREAMMGKTAEHFVPLAHQHRHIGHRQAFAQAPKPRKMGADMKLSLLCANGRECPVDISIRSAHFRNAQVTILSIRDQTALRALEAQLKVLDHDAYHDPMTNLPNRRMLHGHLVQLVSRAKRHQHKIAVCFCDLDGFKAVNDQHGHPAGDQVLIETAQRMNICVRSEDVVARLGGDEFVVVLSQIEGAQDATTVVGKLIDCIALPYSIGDTCCGVTLSVGISVFPDDADAPDVLLSKADTALYQAKKRGKNQYCFFADLP